MAPKNWHLDFMDYQLNNMKNEIFKPTETNPVFDGVQNVYSFDNGYGASVVRHYMSHGGDRGLWEIAVLKDGELTYDTPITDDVIGFVPTEKVQDILESINAL